MKENLEEIENEILRIGRIANLDREDRKVLSDFYNTMSQEEQLCRKKYIVVFLKEGDKNTKFLKIATLRCRSYNRINTIKRINGTLEIKEQDIK